MAGNAKDNFKTVGIVDNRDAYGITKKESMTGVYLTMDHSDLDLLEGALKLCEDPEAAAENAKYFLETFGKELPQPTAEEDAARAVELRQQIAEIKAKMRLRVTGGGIGEGKDT